MSGNSKIIGEFIDHVHIVPVNKDQWKVLQEISRITFLQSFGAENSPEDMNAYIEKSFSDYQIQFELGNSLSRFYFAKIEDTIIGYLKLNMGNAQTEFKGSHFLEIERIYVLQGFQGKQIGNLLCQKALSEARRSGVKCIWLGVWERNLRAIEFYKRNGFVVFDEHIFMLGNDRQRDILMKLEL